MVHKKNQQNTTITVNIKNLKDSKRSLVVF